jgi:hypothetical protein
MGVPQVMGVPQCLFVLLALLSQGVAAATIAIDVTNSQDAIEIEGSAEVDADPQAAWRVLTDYEHYVDFIPDMHVSRVLARHGATVTVEQAGDVMLWPLHIPLDVTFEVTEMPPTSLISRVVAGNLHAFDSRYVLSPTANGVHLQFTGKLDLGHPLFGAIERFTVGQNIARRFRALANEIERRGAADPPAS